MTFEKRLNVLAAISTVVATAIAFVEWRNHAAAEQKLVIAETALERDKSEKTIRNFYDYLDQKTYVPAWGLIHPARKAIIEPKIKNSDDFGKMYLTNQSHENLRVVLDKIDSARSHYYWVSFTAHDRFPYASLYHLRSQPLQSAINEGIVNSEKLLAKILEDLRTNYEVPEAQVEPIRAFILKTKLEGVFGPKLPLQLGEEFHLKFKGVNEDNVETFYLLHLWMLEAQDGWKVRDGLFPPAVESRYQR